VAVQAGKASSVETLLGYGAQVHIRGQSWHFPSSISFQSNFRIISKLISIQLINHVASSCCGALLHTRFKLTVKVDQTSVCFPSYSYYQNTD